MTTSDDADHRPGTAVPPRGDGLCLALAARVRSTRETIDAIMAVDKRDIEDVPGLVELWDELVRLIDDLCSTPAGDVAEITAKARLAILLDAYAGVQGAKIAISLANDLVAQHSVDGSRVPWRDRTE